MTSPLDAATMAELQALDASFMTEQLTIEDVVFVPDGGGGTTTTTTTRTVEGYFWSVSGDESGEDQVRAMGKHRCALPMNTQVSATAAIIRANGARYAIKFVFPLDTYDTSVRLGLEDA